MFNSKRAYLINDFLDTKTSLKLFKIDDREQNKTSNTVLSYKKQNYKFR